MHNKKSGSKLIVEADRRLLAKDFYTGNLTDNQSNSCDWSWYKNKVLSHELSEMIEFHYYDKTSPYFRKLKACFFKLTLWEEPPYDDGWPTGPAMVRTDLLNSVLREFL